MNGDDLVVSGGGSTAVAVDELFVDAARLGATESIVLDWIDRLGVIQRGLDGLGLVDPMTAWGTASPMWVLRSVGVCLDGAADQAREVQTALVAAAERYGATERMIDGLWQLGASLAAPWLGMALTSPLVVGGALLAAGGQWAGSRAWHAAGLGQTPLETWLGDHHDLLSDPEVVRLVRIAADHTDEFLAGALHLPIPAPLVSVIGANIGAPENASMALGVAGVLGLIGSRTLVDAPVTVERSASRTVRSPSGVGGLADRVPSGGEDAPQIRIERYGEGDDRRFIVYIGGTVELGLTAGEQPFDMTSNLYGVADDDPLDELRWAGAESGAGERAVREAMRQAGVQAGDPLLAVGYSGGGIVAAKLAADPELNVVGAVNLGGPVASAPTRDGVGLLSIEHEEDVVPATGGSGHPSAERVEVSRSVLERGRQYDAPLPAHELARYRETAALVDESDEARLAGFRALVDQVAGGAGERTDWIATRDLSPATTPGER
ncbi:hypothetical protein ACFWN7_12205 [Agromyces sp. NPDC058484]|uniref:hypothetical protein n=1 Tax=Agromyces sp. NPDC058484 TaxID=3346524 RepID=UPI003665737E